MPVAAPLLILGGLGAFGLGWFAGVKTGDVVLAGAVLGGSVLLAKKAV